MGNVDYKLKIHKLKRRIAILESKKKLQIKKATKTKRIERARKLLKLGIIFEITMTEVYSIELIVGYLKSLDTKSYEELEYFRYLGNKVLDDISIEKHDKNEVVFLSTEERRKRNHKLISMGALFEMTDTDKLELVIQVGYIEEIHELKEQEIKKLEILGKQFLDNRRKEK